MALAGHAVAAQEALERARETPSRRYVAMERQWLALAQPWVVALLAISTRFEQLGYLLHAADAAAHAVAVFAQSHGHNARAAQSVQARVARLTDRCQHPATRPLRSCGRPG